MDRQGPVAALRSAVAQFGTAHLPDATRWCVALSGGADSLALTAAAATLRPTTALIVDHGLQAESADVAARARQQALDLGCVAAQVLPVDVGRAGGVEAAARSARYAALDGARAASPVLLAHTLDDQAETVLMGLGRGSGARSIAGMRPYAAPWGRPLLAVRRAGTEAACAELGLDPWRDPHNDDAGFTRVRLRTEVLPLLEEVLNGGVAEALARTATALREDADTLDEQAARAFEHLVACGEPTVAQLRELAGPVRRRVLRRWLLEGDARDLSDGQIRAVDALITHWRGQGGVAVSSSLHGQRLFASRHGGRLILSREPVR